LSATGPNGSTAVTAAVTPIRIVCAKTLGAALRQAEDGAGAQRTFRLRHTGNLETKLAEARQVLVTTINYQRRSRTRADRLALEPIFDAALERQVLGHLWVIDEDTGAGARVTRDCGRYLTSRRTIGTASLSARYAAATAECGRALPDRGRAARPARRPQIPARPPAVRPRARVRMPAISSRSSRVQYGTPAPAAVPLRVLPLNAVAPYRARSRPLIAGCAVSNRRGRSSAADNDPTRRGRWPTTTV
jgi:Domain of unknown function (DUF932)